MKNNKGFSLVELIVVIAIMAILAAVAIPTFATFITKANVASDVSFVNDLAYAAKIAHTASGKEVTEVQVTVDEDGGVTAAAYKVGGVAVVINPKATADADKVSCTDEAIAEAAADTLAAIDWTYTFKNSKDGTFAIDANNAKALAPATAITVTTPTEPDENGGEDAGDTQN